MNILVIGGTGLISTEITRQLEARGDRVTHYNRGKREPRIPNRARQIVGDRTDYAAFEAQMRGEEQQFDCVIDMICYKPEDARSLVRAFAGRTDHLIVCSTVDVYAKPASRYPITESETIHPPAWDYARNKALCEAILWEAHARGDVPVTIPRPAHTYAESAGFFHSVSIGGFLKRLRQGKPVIVHGDGSSLWVSCHAEDVARAFVGAVCNPKAYGKGYNVTSEEWMTWNRYVQTLAEAMGAPEPRLAHIPTAFLRKVIPQQAFVTDVNFQFNNIFDNSAAKDDLGFAYSIPFLDGARRAVAWLDEQGRIDGSSDDDALEDRVIEAWERLGAQMAEELTTGGTA